MPLIACPDCQTEISDQAPACVKSRVWSRSMKTISAPRTASTESIRLLISLTSPAEDNRIACDSSLTRRGRDARLAPTPIPASVKDLESHKGRSSMSRTLRPALAASLFVLLAVPALAQRTTGGISGTVKDAEGNPVAGAFVVVGEDRNREDEDRRDRGPPRGRGGRDGERGEGEASPDAPAAPEEPRPPEPLSPFRAVTATESDAAGKFLFDTLSSGRYSLSVQAEDFVAWRQDAIELEAPVKVDVVLDPGIALEGKVVSTAGGEAVAGARVVLRRENDERREVKTDEEGRYTWRLFPGKYDVSVSAQGYGKVTKQVTVKPKQQVILDFTLEKTK